MKCFFPKDWMEIDKGLTLRSISSVSKLDYSVGIGGLPGHYTLLLG